MIVHLCHFHPSDKTFKYFFYLIRIKYFRVFSCLIVWYPTDRVCLPRQVKPLRIVQHSALCCSCQKNQNQASGGDGEYKYLLPVNPANPVNPISIPKYSKCIQNDIPIPIIWWNFFLKILNITDIELLLIWAYIFAIALLSRLMHFVVSNKWK